MNEDARYNIISFGLTQDGILYVVQWEPGEPELYSLWLAEGRPDNMVQKDVEEYMQAHDTDGSSITGSYLDVIEELQELI